MRKTYLAMIKATPGDGVFMRLPDTDVVDNDELLDKFNELYAELGDLSGKFRDFTRDDAIDAAEQRSLRGVGQHIHRTVEELLALTFRVFCKPAPGDVKDGD